MVETLTDNNLALEDEIRTLKENVADLVISIILFKTLWLVAWLKYILKTSLYLTVFSDLHYFTWLSQEALRDLNEELEENHIQTERDLREELEMNNNKLREVWHCNNIFRSFNL